jgi:1-acyl-sn-glycerol-3-phosphate acyltransferase
MRRHLGRAALRAVRFQVVGTPPDEPVCVIVGAPHTAWRDVVLVLAVAWRFEVRVAFLATKEVFASPWGPLLRRNGGIPVDREHPEGLVDELATVARAAAAGRSPRHWLVLAPEGAMRRMDGWKSGFYRIARAADIPVMLAGIDGPTRTVTLGPVLRLTGDVRADMDRIRAFYATQRGIHPHKASPVRLRHEPSTPVQDDDPDAPQRYSGLA